MPYTDVKVGDTVSKTLYFKAKSVADAAYERITVGVYDVSKANGQITEEGRLGEKRVYVLLPGNDGNLPKVTFPSVSPEIIYSSGTRHLYAAVTNSAMLDDAANWNIFAESDAHGKKIAIPHENISIKDGVMDIPALTVINKMGLSAEWYPGLDLRANIVVNLFEGVIYGDYYIRAVYSREDVVNGAAVSKTKINVENKNTPDAATILSAAPAGNLMFALKLGDAPVTGYKVTVYNEDMTLTELSDMDFKKEDGNLITVGGSYSAAAEDGSEVTAGLSGGRSYYIGVTPYNEADGSAVYGKEVLSEKLFLPEMTTPTVDITADKEKKTRTEEVITESGRSLSETLVFTENDVTFTAAISEKASGTWRLDSGGETEFINSDSVKIALSEITEGKHSLTVKGKDLEGDGFIATYVFTVDTLSPRLLAKIPVNGAMYKDGAIEFSGVTDSEAIFTVKCDDMTVIDGVPVNEMGSFDPSTGVFSADLEIPDPDGEMRKTLEIRVSDDVVNSETRKVALTNGALSEIRSIALTFDGATVGGNIKSTEAVSGKIGAVAVMNDGTIIKLNNDDLDFSFTAVSGEAELKDGGEFTASKGAQGIITARLAATDSAFYNSTACFGAENNGFTGTVSVSSTVGGKVTGAGQFAPGDRVTLTATANKGYRFEKWRSRELTRLYPVTH